MSTAGLELPFKPLRSRAHHVFLSHAHVDRVMVGGLRKWLEDAGLTVWFDAEKIQAGQPFAQSLPAGVAESQSMIVAVSKASIESQWVRKEQAEGSTQNGVFPQFPVIPVRLENVALPPNLFAQSAVDAIGGTLTGPDAALLLRSIHGVPDQTPPEAVKNEIVHWLSGLGGDAPSAVEGTRVPTLYVTCGWRAAGNEKDLRTRVCRVLGQSGCYLIGDAEDHPHMDLQRIAGLMSSCTGHLVILPRRGNATSLNDAEYSSLSREVELGRQSGLPQFCVHERGLQAPAGMELTHEVSLDVPNDDSLEDWATEIHVRTRSARRPAYVFVATDYEDTIVKDHVVRHITQITGLPCLKGKDFQGKVTAPKIEHALRNASLVISNVVSKSTRGLTPPTNENTCIEAGIAMGAGVRLQITARRGPQDRWKVAKLPFMIRHHDVATYGDDQHLMAIIHRTVRPFRRRILN